VGILGRNPEYRSPRTAIRRGLAAFMSFVTLGILLAFAAVMATRLRR
jgi:hypothetical protein